MVCSCYHCGQLAELCGLLHHAKEKGCVKCKSFISMSQIYLHANLWSMHFGIILTRSNRNNIYDTAMLCNYARILEFKERFFEHFKRKILSII